MTKEGDTTFSTFDSTRKMIKIINSTHFAFLNHTIGAEKDSATSSFYAGGGEYILVDSTYTEKLEYFADPAGRWLKSSPSAPWLLRRLAITAAGLFAVALLLHFTGINPTVKRIWTPAWTLFSGGWCLVLLAAFYYVVDVQSTQRAFFPLIVVGMNSIAAYVLAHTVVGFIDESFRINLSQQYDLLFGEAYKTLVSGFIILAVQWLILYWMYKKKLFIRI